MTWGIPTDTFLHLHVALSLIGIASGFVVLYGLLNGYPLAGWTALFLATTILTGVTGFPLPPFDFDPARAVGIILLVLLAAAVMALYLNVFVGVTQAFQKLSFLQPLAPTQSEPPFQVTQLVVLVIFIVLGVVAVVKFRSTPKITA
jgi:hypothetical protein